MLERQVAELNAELMTHVSGYADLLGEYFDAQGEALATVRANRMIQVGDRLQVPPPLLPVSFRTRLRRWHTAFRRALDEVFDRRMGGQWSRLADELRLDDATRRYVNAGRRPRWATLGRPDCVLHDDVITMVEPNAGSSCGAMPDTDILGRIFESAPVIGDFLRTAGAVRPDAMGAVARLLRSRLHHADRSPAGLVIVSELAAEWDGDGINYCDVFAAELRRHGIRAEACAVEDLSWGTGPVTWQGQRVELIYRTWGEQPDPSGQFPALEPALQAAAAGQLILVDDLGDQIACNKTVLASLSEELDAGGLPGNLASELAGFVPWTRLCEDGPAVVDGIKVDLLPWCQDHQQDLVIKPGSGYHGRGVTLGCEVASSRWASALSEAAYSTEAWLVQRLVRSNPVEVSVSREGTLTRHVNFADYGYFAVGDMIPAAAIRRNAPLGTMTRRVKRAGHGPVFFV